MNRTGEKTAVSGRLWMLLRLAAISSIVACGPPASDPSEGVAIGTMRTLISAEAQYSSSNGWLYDTPDCLAAPAACIPGYSGKRERFLDPASTASRGNYVYAFHPGPPPAELDPQKVSRSSVTEFAFTAVPVGRYKRWRRAFCGDGEGIICEWKNGKIPSVVGGRCPPGCTPIS
jgi:hypothetical protein